MQEEGACVVVTLSQARVSAPAFKDPGKSAWAEHFLELTPHYNYYSTAWAFLVWVVVLCLGRANSHPVTAHERGSMIG